MNGTSSLSRVAALALCATPIGAVMADSFDYTRYTEILSQFVDDQGRVDYAALKESREELDAFIAALGPLREQDIAAWPEEAQIAFWLNAYNSITLKRIIDHYPIKPGGIVERVRFPKNSIRQIKGVWTQLTDLVAGEQRTLDAIEHEILRADFDEPRIHMALVCAAQSCPPLRNDPYQEKILENQLDDQTRRFLERPANFRIDRANKRVYLSSIFTWFDNDFIKQYAPTSAFAGRKGSEAAVLNFVASYSGDDDADFLRKAAYTVEFTDYDWTLNEQP